MNYSIKSLSKPLLFTLLAIISVIAVASVLVNNFLLSSKSAIEQNLSGIFNHRVNIERISFLPHNFIIARNISFSPAETLEKNRPILIERVKCRFSLFKLITKRDFIITQINFDGACVSYAFARDNFKDILEALKALTGKQPIKTKIRNARLNITEKGKSGRWLGINATSTIHPGGGFVSSGSINLSGYFSKKNLQRNAFIPPDGCLNYRLRVLQTEEVYVIENMSLESSQYSLNFWGMLENNVLMLSGSSFFPDFPDFNIYDLSCVIKFRLPSIEIANLSFSLKNTPFGLNGEFYLSRSPVLNLKLSAFPNQPHESRLNNPGRFDMIITGILRKRKFNGTVDAEFLRRTKTKKHHDKLETVFKDLFFQFTNEGKIKMFFKGADLSYVSDGNAYEIFLENFETLFYSDNRKIKFTGINSKIYDGLLQGQGWIDTTQTPFESSFDIRVNDVSANRLHSLIPYGSKIYGNLSSEIQIRNYPDSKLTGKVTINNGLLDNIVFFNWTTDFLNIPPLNQIDFQNLYAEFVLNEEGISLEKINLESERVKFNGYFTLYENDLVSSKLSLSFSKELLMNSPKLKKIFNYFDKEVPFLKFDFQLSGFFQTMNFKWLESGFKQFLKDLLPYRVKSKLEEATEKIIKSISEK